MGPPEATAGTGVAPARVRVARAAARWVRRTPATHILLLILVVTTLLLQGLDQQTASRVLHTASTNLVHMARDAPRVLFLSAFLVDGTLLLELVEVEIVLGLFERSLGTARLVSVFAAAHIGATLVTTVGIWWEVRTGTGGRSLVYPVDVGISYGLLACAAVLATRIPRRAVAAAASAAVAGFVVVGTVQRGTFTDWGHLAAVAIGFAMAPLVSTAPKAPRRRPAALAGFAAALAGVAAVFGVAAAIAGRSSSGQAIAAPAQTALVVGRPPSCPAPCSLAVVEVVGAGQSNVRTVQIPPGVAVRHGERIPLPAESASVLVAGRADLQSLFAATSSMAGAVAVGVVIVALRGRSRRRRSAGHPAQEQPIP